MQKSALCRSRRELSNAHLLAKFGLDTAENEPCQVCPIPRNAAASSRPGLEDERQGLLQLILRGREAPIDARAAHRVQFRGEFLDLFILGLSISGISSRSSLRCRFFEFQQSQGTNIEISSSGG